MSSRGGAAVRVKNAPDNGGLRPWAIPAPFVWTLEGGMTGSLVFPSKQCVATTILFIDAIPILTMYNATYTFKNITKILNLQSINQLNFIPVTLKY
jgi:hypothetical protein